MNNSFGLNKGWLIIIILVTVLLFSACSAQSDETQVSSNEARVNTPDTSEASTIPPNSTNDAAATTTTEEGEEPEEPVTLTIYQTVLNVTEEAFMQDYGNMIEKEFPEVTLEFIPYTGSSNTPTELLVAGVEPDIVYASVGHTFFGLLDVGLEQDISDLIAKYDYDLSRLEPTTIERQRQFASGGIYGLPVMMNTLVLFYNKDLFDRFGVSYPENNMTWDELYEVARLMSRNEEGVEYRGFGMAAGAMFTVNPLSLSFVNEETHEAQFESESYVRLIENFSRFFSLPGNEVTRDNVGLMKQRALFDTEQTLAMFVNTASFAGTTYKDILNWDVVSLPSFSDSPGVGSQVIPTFFYVTKLSDNRDKAFEVISYLTSDEFQTNLSRSGNLTVLNNEEIKQLYGIDNEYFVGKGVGTMLPEKNASPAPLTKYDSLAIASFQKAFDQIILGEKDMNTALREATEEANQKISAEKGD